MMRRFSKTVALVGAVGALWVIAATPAHAYIDPQSGSYVIQILIAGLAAGGLAIATFWRRILSFLRRLGGRGEQDKGTPTAADASPSVTQAEAPPVVPRQETSNQPADPGRQQDASPLDGAAPQGEPTPPADEAPERHP